MLVMLKKKGGGGKNEGDDYMFSVANTQCHTFDWSVGCHAALSKSRLACTYMILYNSRKLFSKGD